MIKTQKPITFKNICGAIVDFKELAKAILWYSDRPVCSTKKIYLRLELKARRTNNEHTD